MGRIQMMKPLVDLDLHLWPELGQVAALALEGGMAESAERDVHAPPIPRQGLEIQRVEPRCPHQVFVGCRALCHPGRRRTRRRSWGWRPWLQNHRSRSSTAFLRRKGHQPLELSPEGVSFEGRLEIPHRRELDETQACHPIWMAGRRGQGDRTAKRVPDQVESTETSLVGSPQHAGDLQVEAVVRRRFIAGIDLEILGDAPGLITERLAERSIGQSSRQHTARKQDRVEFVCSHLLSKPRRATAGGSGAPSRPR